MKEKRYARSPTSGETFINLLYLSIISSFFEDIQKEFKKPWPKLDRINRLAFELKRTDFFKKNVKICIQKLESEELIMARSRSNKKSDKKYQEVKDYKCDNGNIFGIRIYENPSTSGKGYKRFFSMLEINGVVISGGIMRNKKDDKIFFQMPSYYSESKEEYINVVNIYDEGLKEDLDQFMEYIIDFVDNE